MSLLKELKGQVDPQIKSYDQAIGEVDPTDFFGAAIDAKKADMSQPQLKEGQVMGKFGHIYDKDLAYEEEQKLKGEEIDPDKLYPDVGLIKEYHKNIESVSPEDMDIVMGKRARMSIGQQEDPTFGWQAETPGQQLPFKQSDLFMDPWEKAVKSWNYGIGNVIEGIGDIIDFSGAISPTTKLTGYNLLTPVADWIREGSQSWKEGNLVYDPQMFNEFSFENLLHGHWWQTRMPKVLPDALSMLFGAGLAAKVTQKIALRAGKKLIKKGLIKPGARYGGVVYKRGGMGAGSMFTTVGGVTEGAGLLTTQLSTRGLLVSNMVGGGVGMNMLNGARISGNAYNEAKEKGFSEEVAGEMAAGIFMDNLKWIGIENDGNEYIQSKKIDDHLR